MRVSFFAVLLGSEFELRGFLRALVSDLESLFVILGILIHSSKSIEHMKFMAGAAVRASNFYLLLSRTKAAGIVCIETGVYSAFCNGA